MTGNLERVVVWKNLLLNGTDYCALWHTPEGWLPVGGTESVVAAWVNLPDLAVQPLPQRYTRITNNTYRYESSTGFSAEIMMDDLGLVTTYPGGWERIASATP
jgi:hypothetical protein